MNPIALLKFMLPGFPVEYFETVLVDNSQENLPLYFEEKAKPPKEFDNIKLISKGFTNEISIQDFTLRGKFVFLHIKFSLVAIIVANKSNEVIKPRIRIRLRSETELFNKSKSSRTIFEEGILLFFEFKNGSKLLVLKKKFIH